MWIDLMLAIGFFGLSAGLFRAALKGSDPADGALAAASTICLVVSVICYITFRVNV